MSNEVRTNADQLPELGERTYNTWSKYEDIAMHFNDLLMRWRLQAISGLAALITVSGFAVGSIGDDVQRYWGMSILATTFLFGWLGLAVLDLCYYSRLLIGAVDEIKELETSISIKLSTRIDKWAKCGS